MIFLPHQYDQPINAKVLESFGIGATLDWKKNLTNHQALCDDIRDIFEGVRENYGLLRMKVLKVRNNFRKSDNADHVVEQIEKLVQNSREKLLITLNESEGEDKQIPDSEIFDTAAVESQVQIKKKGYRGFELSFLIGTLVIIFVVQYFFKSFYSY